MDMLQEGNIFSFFVHKQLDRSSYVWALPKYIEFTLVLASFYSSVSKFCSAISPWVFIQSTSNFAQWSLDIGEVCYDIF